MLRDDSPFLLGSGCAATVHTALSAASRAESTARWQGAEATWSFPSRGLWELRSCLFRQLCHRASRLSEVKSKLLRRFLKVTWNLVAPNMFPSASNSFTRKTGLLWGPFGSREPQTALSTHFGGYQQGPQEAVFWRETESRGPSQGLTVESAQIPNTSFHSIMP